MIRLFVALALPPEIAEALGRLTLPLPGARWVEDADYHLTLRFIGEVDEDIAEDYHTALSQVRAPAFSLALRGLGLFGDRRGVNALWAGVPPTPPLTHLRDKVETALVRAGLSPEGRRFHPHVTLARFRGQGEATRIETLVARHSLWTTPPFEVTHFTLFSSHLGRKGAHYTVEADYPLRLTSPATS